ncbi:hypothetical protein [Kibdelosporangium philippinense]|uniref:hypothetical protein n=1 Tax=Kibdelosporangium philippinense TaxID=211113 RepID=UPI003609EE24
MPFLTAGFGMYLAYGLVLMTVGFLLQDRLGLTARQTAAWQRASSFWPVPGVHAGASRRRATP